MQRTRVLPILLSATMTEWVGRLPCRYDLTAVLASMIRPGIFSVGLNYSFGALQMIPFLEELPHMVSCCITAYPSVGNPDDKGNYPTSVEDMDCEMQRLVDGGFVNIIGGRCGTTDSYIAKYISLVKVKNQWVKQRNPILQAG